MRFSPRELDARWKGDGVRAFSVHPGGIMTPLQRHLPKDELVALGWVSEDGGLTDRVKIFQRPEQGRPRRRYGPRRVHCSTVWAAFIAKIATFAAFGGENAPSWGMVEPHACDSVQATKLWLVTETMISA
ncbi:MAG: hypothetical protein R3C40_03235 [Parvularculaceae bacterium]